MVSNLGIVTMNKKPFFQSNGLFVDFTWKLLSYWVAPFWDTTSALKTLVVFKDSAWTKNPPNSPKENPNLKRYKVSNYHHFKGATFSKPSFWVYFQGVSTKFTKCNLFWYLSCGNAPNWMPKVNTQVSFVKKEVVETPSKNKAKRGLILPKNWWFQ